MGFRCYTCVMKDQPYSSFEQAIEYMKSSTASGIRFSISFVKQDGCLVHISNCLLFRSRRDKTGAYRIGLYDTNAEQMKSCFVPLIISVNNRNIQLK